MAAMGLIEGTALEAIATRIAKAAQALLPYRYRIVLVVFDVEKPEQGVGVVSGPPDVSRVAARSWLDQFKEV